VTDRHRERDTHRHKNTGADPERERGEYRARGMETTKSAAMRPNDAPRRRRPPPSGAPPSIASHSPARWQADSSCGAHGAGIRLAWQEAMRAAVL
jgi:hypothetical protein